MSDPTESLNMAPTNYENWGKLLKTWSTGKNYLGDGQDYTRPKTLDDLKDQAERAQVGLVLPASVTELKVVVGRSDTLLLRIPPADLVLAIEERLATHEYQVPAFYSDAFNGQAATPLPDLPARLRFHAQRIGDYSIAHCQ